MNDVEDSENFSKSANSSFEDTNLKKTGTKTFSAEKGANALNSSLSNSSKKEGIENGFQDLARNDSENQEDNTSTKKLDNGKVKNSREPLDNEVESNSNFIDYDISLNELIEMIQTIKASFKIRHNDISNIISIFKSFKSLKPNKIPVFLQKINAKYESSISCISWYKNVNKCNKEGVTISDGIPRIKKEFLGIMKTSLEQSTTERVLKDVYNKVLSGFNQFYKFTQIYTSQLEEAVELGQKICDGKINLELKVEHWNEKVCDMIKKLEDVTLKTNEKFKTLKLDDASTCNLISYVNSVAEEDIEIFETWKY